MWPRNDKFIINLAKNIWVQLKILFQNICNCRLGNNMIPICYYSANRLISCAENINQVDLISVDIMI